MGIEMGKGHEDRNVTTDEIVLETRDGSNRSTAR